MCCKKCPLCFAGGHHLSVGPSLLFSTFFFKSIGTSGPLDQICIDLSQKHMDHGVEEQYENDGFMNMQMIKK